ncbi:craniofacial development protein 2-like protein, partial [Tanacetum coccineum]
MVTSCLFSGRWVGGFRGHRGNGRLAGTRRFKVGSWNIRSLTRKLFVLADVLVRHNVEIARFQETKWKGSSTKEENGYKL